MPNNNNLNIGLRSILEKEKLNTSNFIDWKRNLRIVLKYERKLDVLEHPPPQMNKNSTNEEVEEFDASCKRSLDVACLMRGTMILELQKKFEGWDAYHMMQQLEIMFVKNALTERYETIKAILGCKLNKGEPIGPHVLKMMCLFDNLQRFNVEIGQQLAVDIVLHSLHDGYDTFKLNYYMDSMDKSLTDLICMLKSVEQNISLEPLDKEEVLMVQKKNIVFKNNKGKQKKQIKGKQKPNPQEDHVCFYREISGHWKRNCPKYLKDKKEGKVPTTAGPNTFVGLEI